MKFKQKLSLLAATAAFAIGFVPSVVHADALAQSVLDVSGLTFKVGDGALGSTGGSVFTILSITGAPSFTSDANAALVGFAGVADTAIPGGSKNCLGACGFYTPNAIVAGAPLGTYAGASGAQFGNALVASAGANTDAIVSLKPNGDGSTQSNTNINASFMINVAVASSIEIAFNATSFLRGMLTKDDFATAATGWTFTIIKVGAPAAGTAFSWQPNGAVGGATGVTGNVGGVEYADAFNMNDTVSAVLAGDDISVSNGLGSFEAETGLLQAGSYRVSLRHTSTADARLIPEPGSLALLGVAMFGAAAAARRRAKK